MKKLFWMLVLTLCTWAWFAFASTITSVDQLPASCTKATDECNNTCVKYNGYRACTKMGCEVKKTPVCTSSESWTLVVVTPPTVTPPMAITPIVTTPTPILNPVITPPVMCTMDYTPVCWSLEVQCIRAPCQPLKITYGNLCMLNAEGATLLYTGECSTWTVSTWMVETWMIVWNDSDEYGCKWSAWYSWSQSAKACVRVREQDATPLEKAFDFAYTKGITTTISVDDFRAKSSITRQEAAKMLVEMTLSVYNKEYSSMPNDCTVAYKDEYLFWPTLKDYVYDACALNLMKGDNGFFNPNGNITRWQALAVIMRAVDGWKEETTNPWWMVYADRAKELGLITFTDSDYKWFDKAITRWELIQRIQTIYLNSTLDIELK